MQGFIHRYPITIKESYLDSFHHVNNAMYLTLFEDARWDMISKAGFDRDYMHKHQIGPVIIEINIRYLKELLLGDNIIITTQTTAYSNKMGTLQHTMLRGDEVCCTSDIKISLWDLSSRKLIAPTNEWLRAIGWQVD
jgi:YbgC/YbaW family acyl-CoA thioester hydrolase